MYLKYLTALNPKFKLLAVLISITVFLILVQIVNLPSSIESVPEFIQDDRVEGNSDTNIQIDNQQTEENENTEPEKEFTTYDDESIDAKIDYTMDLVDFLNEKLFKPIKDAKPTIGAINNDNHFTPNNKFAKGGRRVPRFSSNFRENKADDYILTKEYLTSFVQLSKEEKQALTDSHDKFKESLLDSFPEEIEKKFNGNGIIYVGGGKYNWLVLVSLKQLRNTGCTTPVEIFISNPKEYSYTFCDVIFPALGAKCVTMSNFITLDDFNIRRFGLKLFALMLTSFENVIMIDSDCVPVKNPEYLYDSEVYNKHGLLLWPDFWRRSTSPHWYDIAGIHVNETNQVRFSYGDARDHPEGLNTVEDYNRKISFHDLEGTLADAASETGQLMINKKKHASTLMLAFYYNYYGQDYYYILFGQGQAGEGDKDTFMGSAHELGLPYYQVKEYVREFDKNTRNRGEKIGHVSSMGQYDPVVDYQNFLTNNYDDYPYDSQKVNYWRHHYKNSTLLFLHCLSPKLTLLTEGQDAGWIMDALKKPMEEKYRIYGDYLYQEIGYDFEIEIWKTLKWILCSHGNIDNVLNSDERYTCEAVKSQIDFLENNIVDISIRY